MRHSALSVDIADDEPLHLLQTLQSLQPAAAVRTLDADQGRREPSLVRIHVADPKASGTPSRDER